jgi:glycosyltransferase involved in cell wall biosynthesis
MRILVVTDSWYPDGVGGKHIYVYYLTRGLAARGHDMTVLTFKYSHEIPKEECVEGIRIIRYESATSGPFVFLRRPLMTLHTARRAFNCLIKDASFDLISLHTVLPAYAILRSFQSIQSIKIFTFHSSFYQEVLVQSRKKHYIGVFNSVMFRTIRWMEKVTLHRVDRIIVLSKFNEQQLDHLYRISHARIKRIPGGVDCDRFRPGKSAAVRQKLRLPQEKIIFFTVRRLIARMGLKVLIDAFKYLVADESNILLLIAGDGYLREPLQHQVQQLNLSGMVSLLGRINEQDLVSYYQAADCFILPTQELEGFGMVTLEAMACGLPVLGTPVGGTVDILTQFDLSLLFNDKTAESITKGIRRFLQRKDEWARLRQRARKYVIEHYSWDDIVRKNEEFFELLSKE